MRTLVLFAMSVVVTVALFADEKAKPAKEEPKTGVEYRLTYERDITSLPLHLTQPIARVEASAAPERSLVIQTPLGGFWLFAPEPAQTAFDSCRPHRSNFPTDPFSAR